MLFLRAEAESEFAEEVEYYPQEDTDPEIQKKSPVEREDLVVKNVGQAILKDVIDGIAADDGHKDFCEFTDEDFHELKEVMPESQPPNCWGRFQKPEFMERSSGCSWKRSSVMGPRTKTAISGYVCYHTTLRIG